MKLIAIYLPSSNVCWGPLQQMAGIKWKATARTSKWICSFTAKLRRYAKICKNIRESFSSFCQWMDHAVDLTSYIKDILGVNNGWSGAVVARWLQSGLTNKGEIVSFTQMFFEVPLKVSVRHVTSISSSCCCWCGCEMQHGRIHGLVLMFHFHST